jgi:hypothetical protein
LKYHWAAGIDNCATWLQAIWYQPKRKLSWRLRTMRIAQIFKEEKSAAAIEVNVT